MCRGNEGAGQKRQRKASELKTERPPQKWSEEEKERGEGRTGWDTVHCRAKLRKGSLRPFERTSQSEHRRKEKNLPWERTMKGERSERRKVCVRQGKRTELHGRGRPTQVGQKA